MEKEVKPLRPRSLGTKLTEVEYARVEAAALKAGVGLSEWCRRAVLEFAEREGVQTTGRELRALVRGIHRAVAEAVRRHAEARDAQLQRAHAEHFAFLAHELRAPVANVSLSVNLLEEGVTSDAVVPRVRRAVDRMRELLDNEISRARLDAGATLRIEPVSLRSLPTTVVMPSLISRSILGCGLVGSS